VRVFSLLHGQQTASRAPLTRLPSLHLRAGPSPQVLSASLGDLSAVRERCTWRHDRARYVSVDLSAGGGGSGGGKGGDKGGDKGELTLRLAEEYITAVSAPPRRLLGTGWVL
jgi:hypothetical protein